MNRIFLVTTHQDLGWDSYSDFVVVAANESQARCVHPSNGATELKDWPDDRYSSWIKRDDTASLEVEEIGLALDKFKPGEIICASFHAG